MDIKVFNSITLSILLLFTFFKGSSKMHEITVHLPFVKIFYNISLTHFMNV
jgi:hypothetical protein